MPEAPAQVAFERLGAVARITLDRANKRNAQSRQMLEELDAAIATCEADEAIRAVIIAGAGDHFSAGHDLREAQAARSGFTAEERWAYEAKYYYGFALRIHDLPKVTVAQVQGGCIAAGFMIANMCDLVVAAEDAYFADPVGHSMAAAAVELLVHPWVMGMRQAKEMLFTGARVAAHDALRIGLVNRVVARGELEASALEMATQAAAMQPFAMRLLKRSLNRVLDLQGFRQSLEAHFDTHQLSHLSEEARLIREAGMFLAVDRAKSVLDDGERTSREAPQ